MVNHELLTRVLQTKVVIGRSSDCDIIVPQSINGVSRKHAIIFPEEGSWYVSDNNSTNGVYVNGDRITRVRLKRGDSIKVGHLHLTYVIPQDNEPSDHFEFDDDDGPSPYGSIFINMEDVGRILAALGSGIHQAPHLSRRIGGNETSALDDSPDDSGLPRSEEKHSRDSPSLDSGRGFAWAIDLFTQVGQSLMGAGTLNDMLEGILQLAFANVPAERGMICTYDESTGQITPKMFRSQGEDSRSRLHVSRSVVNHAILARGGLLIKDAREDDRFADAHSIRALAIKSAMCVPLISQTKILGLVYVDTQNLLKPFREKHLEILTALSLFSAVALEQAKLREDVHREQLIRSKLARYHSPGVVEQICKFAVTEPSGRMMTEERDVTVMFTDLSGFTALSERLPAAEVVAILNGVFARLASAVFEYGGTLDKFMGDGMLAFFGAPLPQPDHREKAVHTALRMQVLLAEFNAGQPADLQISMRIGINSGAAIVGEMGSPERCDYTVIGDTVNLASRLESSVAKPGDIVLGPAMGELLKNIFPLIELDEVRVKGKALPLRPWRVLSAEESVQADVST